MPFALPMKLISQQGPCFFGGVVFDQQPGAREVVRRDLEQKLEECLIGERHF